VATKIHSSKRDKLVEIANAHNMTVNELMKNFIENLIDDEGGNK
jgi:predicted DNA-binding ribbon-helix-helix protein